MEMIKAMTSENSPALHWSIRWRRFAL